MSVSISLDFICFGTEPGVLHGAQLGLHFVADVSEGCFPCCTRWVILVGIKEVVFFFQNTLDFAVILIEPDLVVPGGYAEDFQGSRVNCIPEGQPLLLKTVEVWLEVLGFAFHVELEFFCPLRAFQFGCVELLGCFLSLGPSPQLNEEVQFGQDEAVVRPAVSTTHGFSRPHIPPVLGPGDDVINEVPVSRAWVHP